MFPSLLVLAFAAVAPLAHATVYVSISKFIHNSELNPPPPLR